MEDKADLHDILKIKTQIDSLEFLKKAIKGNIISEDELVKKIGMSPDEILEIKSILDIDELDASILSKIDVKIDELRKNYNKRLGTLLSYSALYMFYNWRKALKVKWPGVYRSQPVRSVVKSRIIFLSVLEIKWKDVANRDCIGYFGSGIYSTEFVASHTDTPIEHYVPINGVLLTKNLLNEVFASPPRVVGSGASVHKELVSRIMIGEILINPRLKTQSINLFMSIGIKGKSEALEFLKTVRSDALSDKDASELVFLSALPDFYNKLIVSEDKFLKLMDDDIRGEPGITGYEGALERLNDLYEVMRLDEINEKIKRRLRDTLRFVWSGLIELFQ